MLFEEWSYSEVHRQKGDVDDLQYFIDQFETAWDYLLDAYRVNLSLIKILAMTVEPQVNQEGEFRQLDLIFPPDAPRGWAVSFEMIEWHEKWSVSLFNPKKSAIRSDEFLWNWRKKDIDDCIMQFLEIHPFLDGNGRVASLLYNYLAGSSAVKDTFKPLPCYFGEENKESMP